MAKRDKLDVTDAEWEEARRREPVVRRLASLDRLSLPALREACAQLHLGRTRVRELVAAYRAAPVTSALVRPQRGQPSGTKRLPAPIEAVIEAAIRDVWRTRQKPSVSALVRHIAHDCRAQSLRPPSWDAIKARLDRLDARAVMTDREGYRKAAARFRPVTSPYTAEWALQVVQVDHTLVDVFVVDDRHRLPIQRPWLTLAIDIASRMVAGFHLTLEAPSSASVALALHHAVAPKEAWLAARDITAPWPVSGLPDALHLDNAKEFRAQALKRGAEEHGIDLLHRPVRTPHYGGHIERLIGTMMGEAHLLPGTTFANVAERGNYDPERHAALTLAELEKWLAIQIVGPYHAGVHDGIGLPPSAAWTGALARRPEAVRVPSDLDGFLVDLLPCQERMVRRDGIRLFNIHYWDDVLSVWAGRVETRLSVRFDPRDLSRIWLEAPDGTRWPIRYRDLARPPISLWEHREAQRRLREQGRAAVDEQLIFDAVEAQRALVAEAAAQTKRARRAAQRVAHLTDAEDLPCPPPIATDRPQGLPEPAGDGAVGPAPIPLLPYAVEDWS